LVKPYVENGDIRIFSVATDDEEFVWHRDKENRMIEVLEGDGWQFQVENCLPFLLYVNMRFIINKYEYHRIIKGASNLTLKITKME
jgi:hypothetical protein